MGDTSTYRVRFLDGGEYLGWTTKTRRFSTTKNLRNTYPVSSREDALASIPSWLKEREFVLEPHI